MGDAVLGFVVARVLYDRYPDATEGTLSKMRSAIVSRMNFAHFAQELKIDKQLLLGKGEEKGRILNLVSKALNASSHAGPISQQTNTGGKHG